MRDVLSACPVVLRVKNGRREVLAFRDAAAARRLALSTIAEDETPHQSALRELWEKCGVVARAAHAVGEASIGDPQSTCRFFLAACDAETLPEAWRWPPEKDDAQVFEMFWHPLEETAGEPWEALSRDALGFLTQALDAKARSSAARSDSCAA